jgi:hypothetical protein
MSNLYPIKAIPSKSILRTFTKDIFKVSPSKKKNKTLWRQDVDNFVAMYKNNIWRVDRSRAFAWPRPWWTCYTTGIVKSKPSSWEKFEIYHKFRLAVEFLTRFAAALRYFPCCP